MMDPYMGFSVFQLVKRTGHSVVSALLVSMKGKLKVS